MKKSIFSPIWFQFFNETFLLLTLYTGLHPNVLGPDGQLIPDTSKSVFELRKEQEQLEAEAERLAAQKLHLSILATLGLILLIVTSTCICKLYCYYYYC